MIGSAVRKFSYGFRFNENSLSFEETRRPLVKALIKNDVCSFLLHHLRAVADDRGLGQDLSLQIHQILAVIGHHGRLTFNLLIAPSLFNFILHR